MASSADDLTVLSYFDSLLRQSDMKLLSEGYWLNDNIIGFVFEYLSMEKYASHSSTVCLISPDVTQFIKLAQGAELNIFLEPLGLASRKLVFLAVNNLSAADVAGGSHWSLLVYDRNDDRFHHYDSSAGMNSRSAKDIAAKVKHYLQATSSSVIEEDCPQQTNGSDCGMYVICVLEHILERHLGSNTESDLKTTVTPKSVTSRRHQLQQLIHQLAGRSKKEGNS